LSGSLSLSTGTPPPQKRKKSINCPIHSEVLCLHAVEEAEAQHKRKREPWQEIIAEKDYLNSHIFS